MQHSGVVPYGGGGQAIHARMSRFGKIFAIVLIIAFLEGAGRKWISDSLTLPLVASRDLLCLYAIASLRRLSLTKAQSQIAYALVFWSGALALLGLVQLIVNGGSLFVLAVGLRFWLLYTWFAFAAYLLLTEVDIEVVGRLLSVGVILSAPLVVVQHLSPPGSFLNRQLEGDEDLVYRVSGDVVRTTGTFSFTTGFSTFLIVASPFVFGRMLDFRVQRRRIERSVAFGAMAVCSGVSGSRTSIMFFAISLTAYILLGLLRAKAAHKLVRVLQSAILLGALAFFSSYFTTAIEATSERFTSAAEIEDMGERIVSMVVGEPAAIENFASLGAGLGVGTNFAGSLSTGQRAFLLAETETGRTLMEAGVLGVIFVFAKLACCVFGVTRALSLWKRTRQATPLFLWVSACLALLTWPITGQLSTNVLAGLLVGLSLAVLRAGKNAA